MDTIQARFRAFLTSRLDLNMMVFLVQCGTIAIERSLNCNLISPILDFSRGFFYLQPHPIEREGGFVDQKRPICLSCRPPLGPIYLVLMHQAHLSTRVYGKAS